MEFYISYALSASHKKRDWQTEIVICVHCSTVFNNSSKIVVFTLALPSEILSLAAVIFLRFEVWSLSLRVFANVSRMPKKRLLNIHGNLRRKIRMLKSSAV